MVLFPLVKPVSMHNLEATLALRREIENLLSLQGLRVT